MTRRKNFNKRAASPATMGKRLLKIASAGFGHTVIEGVKKIDTKTAKKLIKAGADLNMQDHHGGTALIYACLFSHVELAMTLIRAGAKLDLQDNSQSTALHRAAWRSATKDVVEALLNAGADPRLKDDAGLTARQYVSDWNQGYYYDLLEAEEKKRDRADRAEARKKKKLETGDDAAQRDIPAVRPPAFKKRPPHA